MDRWVLILRISTFVAIGILAGCDNTSHKETIASECADGFDRWAEKLNPSDPGAVSPQIRAEWKKDLVARCVELGGWDKAMQSAEGAIGDNASIADDAGTVNNMLIAEIKKGQMEFCIPNINDQLARSGMSRSADTVRSYCSCMSNFYFNGISNEELISVIRGVIPERISRGRYEAQGECVKLHLQTPQ